MSARESFEKSALKINFICFAVLIILSVTPVKLNAQNSEIGNWLIYFGNQRINKKWNWWNEVQYRNNNFIGDLRQLVFRTGIGYNLTENNNNVLLGYAYIYSTPYVPGTDKKTSNSTHVIYEQFITRQNFGRVFIQHRYRIEERFFANDFDMRFRYFLSFNIPLNKEVIEPRAIYLSSYNEIFLRSKEPVFDQDRIYGAIGYAINKNLRLETGLMYQIFET